jgi:hypothetical protein
MAPANFRSPASVVQDLFGSSLAHAFAIGRVPRHCRVRRTTSCLSRWSEAASRTTSFIRKGTLPVIAGKPPAATSQPSGVNGMMVTVAAEGTENVEALIPEAREQQGPERPLRDAQENSWRRSENS